MVRVPYPITPAITIFDVWDSSMHSPCSIGSVKTKGYIDDKLRPNISPLR